MRANSAVPVAGERDRSDISSNLDGMIYGEDPSEGFARGRHFLHPKLGFTLDGAGGFHARQYGASRPRTKGRRRRSLASGCRGRSSRATFARLPQVGLDGNVDPASVEEFSVNGFPAATATAGGDNWSFRLFAVRFGSDVYRFIFAAKARTTQVDLAFRESIMSFRRMTLKESQQVSPLRLKIVTVGPNDTVEKLAHRMATSDHALERFRMLNGLGQQDRLKPGEKVKVVVE